MAIISDPPVADKLAHYPLINALLNRRSRRFAKGMTLNGGPLAYASQHTPEPLKLDEEAVLTFAACGITGPALGELSCQSGPVCRPPMKCSCQEGICEAEQLCKLTTLRCPAASVFVAGVKDVFNSSPAPSLNETREGNSKHCDFSRLVLGGVTV